MSRYQSLLSLAAAAPLLAWSAPVAAQSAEREISNPRVLGAEPAPPAQPTLVSATPGGTLLPHERVFDLNIVFTDGRIFNPATGSYDKVRLRSYDGTDVDPKVPYVSPTIEVRPGDTIRVNLDNKLPFDPSCLPGKMAESMDDMPNKPHCFNGTNLHTHGLWVSPTGNSDNVLLSINPGTKFQYEYNIPSDHPAGTFWYHTHRHGSTALQVSSGMAGALIVRGNRLPTPDKHGDLDTLLNGFTERVIVFQQIQYACREAAESGKLGPIKRNNDGTYRCDTGDVGGVESYDDFGSSGWGKSGRYTSLNGNVLPTFKAVQGQIERWRMIHAGVRDTIALKLVKLAPKAQLAAIMSQAQERKFLDQSCTGATLPYSVVAADGITMGAAQQKQVAVFQPGYRFDALMTFPEAGRYCIIDASSPGVGSVNGDTPGPQLLGIVDVAAGRPVGDVGAYVQDALVANANRVMPAAVRAAVIADLRSGLKLTSFTPHEDIKPGDVTGHQELTFFIKKRPDGDFDFMVGNTLNPDDAHPYDPKRVDRKLYLGDVDEWTLTSQLAGHPFHIHVNPFQVVSIIAPDGTDVSAPGAIDKDSKGAVDPQYPGMKGVWKDTLWVKSLASGPAGVYKVTVRTRYERYIGEFVLHCHILDHEDQGMMQNVSIAVRPSPLPKPKDGTTPMGDMQH
ncbi:MAG: multicopper oxidase family protein [Sphingomonas sp.]